MKTKMDKIFTAEKFLKKIKDDLLNHELFNDPYITVINSLDCFEINKAKKFAELYYPHILRTRLYQASTLGITPDENLQFVLAEILYDEYGNGDNYKSHMELYRKFMRGLDLTINSTESYQLIPELKQYINTMEKITRNGNWIAAIGAVGIASEWPIPKYYGLLLNGFRKIPGIKEECLELFSGHIELDLEHSTMIEKAILPYLQSKENQRIFSEGVMLNMNARRTFHAGLYREVFINT